MGVPKFYRWISERYPKINQVVTDSALLPEFDHLYLDMNGIIHGCTHPSHMDVSDVLSERDMMLGIMHYLDRIITQIVKPKVSVYMAIDGVAPRAKLNQQRSRRFRSAKDLAEATKGMPKSNDGTNENAHGVFDSNCITPGTEFMARVSNVIKYFIRKKMKEDPLWRDLKIIFSGHEVPGEGEHKIMEHIRDMKNQPGYQPNTRHCMYGQDADLIMLGLVSHEPHFTLLREIINFGFGGNDNKNALKTVMKFTKQSDFQLLHLSVLREYLQIEFCQGLENISLECTIDDFVFMTFLVGNDFLPHMPSLDIGDGAFDLLFSTYKDQRRQWGEGHYLTHAGELNDAGRLEAFLAVIGAAETEIFEQKEENEAVYIKKRRKWDRRDGKPAGPSDGELQREEHSKQMDYMSMIESMMATHTITDDFVEGWTPIKPGQKDFKGRYYFEKLKWTPLDIEEHKSLRKSYIEGLMWCLAYYYRGCISWGWFYPYHYGPMLSDLINLPRIFEEIKFEIGEPLKPFEQLMGCLPPASSVLVPLPYRKLMCSPDSPIIQFYPENFSVDMNGKRNPWEGVNLLPFIDVKLLKDEIAIHCPDSLLTADEKQRNSRGKVLCYTFDLTANETLPSANRAIGLPDIPNCHSRISILDEPEKNGISFKPELVPGTQIPYPGFPSLNVLPIQSTELIRVGLNCFGSASKYSTMTLTMHKLPQLPPATQLAQNILGKSVYINWPMMHEARVVAVSDATCEIREKKKKKTIKKFTPVEAERWQSDSQIMVQKYLCGAGYPGSGGVQIGDIQIRLKMVPLQGMRTNPVDGSTKKLFGQEEAEVPLQVCLWQAPAPDPRFEERGPLTAIDRFPPDCNVILTKGKYRGCVGTVVGAADDSKVGVKVQIMQPEPPFGLAIARTVQESFISSTDAAKLAKLNPGVFGKIAGSLYVEPGRYDLGLNLKYSEGFCVLGYTRKKQEQDTGKNHKGKLAKVKAWGAGDSVLVVGSSRSMVGGEDNDRNDKGERIQWEYTPKAIRLISLYRQKFPKLFAGLSRQPNERKYDAKMLFGPGGEKFLPEIREWLNSIETSKLPRTPVSTEALPLEAVTAVQRVADARTAVLQKGGPLKESLVKTPASALYREGSTGATDVLLAADLNDDEAPELGDRVVNLCANGVPFGARGTVVTVHDATSGCVEVVMDEEFIGGSSLQGSCSNFRGKLCVWAHLLKISPANSKSLVDQLVPKGSRQAVVEKLISTIEKQTNTEQKVSDSKSKAEVDVRVHDQVKNKARAVQPETAGTSASTQDEKALLSSRHGSAGRSGRRGAWREAIGPDEKGCGFSKVGRGAKSGFSIWKRLTSASAPSSAHSSPNQKTSPTTSDGLKAMLGVKPENSAEKSGVDAAAQVQQGANASAGLKAMLGVGLPTQAKPLPSAADKLLQLMASKQQSGPGVTHHASVPQPSGFNFTYVEEGKVPPAQAYPQQMAMPYNPAMMNAHPGFAFPPGGVHPYMMPMHVPAMPGGVRPTGPPKNDFPPLGASYAEGSKTKARPKKETKAVQPIVPSAVVSKVRK